MPPTIAPPGTKFYYHRGSGLFTPVNGGPDRVIQRPEDPPPHTGPITHGSQLPATSDLAEQVIGPKGTLNNYDGPTDLYGKVLIENALIYEKNLRVRAGADVHIKNSKVIGAYGSANYTIRLNDGGGARLLIEDSTVVCRANNGGSYPISGWGDTSLAIKRSVIRGGLDGVHYHGTGAPVWATGDPFIPWATFLMEDCWLGDNERLPGSHSDLRQSAGTRPNYIRDYLERRNRFMAYSIPMYSDTLTTRANPEVSGYGSCCWINSTDGKGTIGGGSYFGLRDNWFEGGNYMIDCGADGSPAVMTGNLFAPRANFGAVTGGGSWDKRNNRWAYSGTLGNGFVAVGGALIPGSSE